MAASVYQPFYHIHGAFSLASQPCALWNWPLACRLESPESPGFTGDRSAQEMLGWFQALMPKEGRFFDLFERHAGIVVAGAEALRGLLQGGDQVEQYCQQIFEREAEADEVTREVLIAVRRTFITPFDRTDIQELVSSMDDSIDQMNKTAKTITLFEVRSFAPQMQQMGDIILQASRLVLEAMPLLSSVGKNAARLNALTENIIRVEE